MAEIEILIPVAPTRVAEQPLARRPATPENARIAVLDNCKANAAALLDAIGAGLSDQVSVFQKNATAAAPQQVMAHLRQFDAVVLAIAD